MVIELCYFQQKQVNHGVYNTAVNDIYLYKVPIAWISIYFIFLGLQRFSCIFEFTDC